MKRATVFYLLVLVLLPALAQAWQANAGWSQSDVGLQNKGDGFYLGVGNGIPLKSRLFDASYSLDYVQKKGSQLTQFADPVAGFSTEDAKVTLHVIQPSLSFGIAPAEIPLHPRLYIGAGLGLKLKEEWSDFPGQPDQEYGYKDTDISGHVGLSVGMSSFVLDARWTKSLSGQLLVDNQNISVTPGKADDPLVGVAQPEEGFKTETWQLGLGVKF
ncbi:MAG: hypothetical protein ACI9UK_000104 [Candidatus Krumholzibacteriia bacterium]|jgi:hypothetical protein